MISTAGGHGDVNPNKNWIESRGMYVFYLITIVSLHLILLSLPMISISMAWSMTNIMHNLAHLYFLHIIKGAPWMTCFEESNRSETHWEQLDDGNQWTSQKKFLTAIPIILFLLTCIYTKNSPEHFIANFISLVVILLPKMPVFHHLRLFGINKY
ncbi:unnamed protein product [Diamesa serratosioi]